MPPTTAEIRRFLNDAFSDEELKTLCFDYFRDVYDDFTAGMTRGQMIQLLLERCVRREALANLEAALRAERLDQYAARFGAAAPAPAAPAPPQVVPPRRDPHQVFISHAHQDAEFAHRLASDLTQAGWRVWIAPDSIRPGEKWVTAINRGLEESGVFVVALTPAGVASRWVRLETDAAIELENRGEVQFIPLEVAACTVPALWNAYQRIPFRSYEHGLRALLGRLGGAPAVGAAPAVPRVPAQPRTPEPAEAPKKAPIDFDWVTIPAGEFLMGSDPARDRLAYDDETPQHRLYLPAYRIARTPVTVAQFAAFVAANPGYRTTAEQRGSAWNWTGSEWKNIQGADWAHPRGPGSDVRDRQDHPVTCVSWDDAMAFCRWAGVRLPSEAEWEKAARGTDGRLWPWGDREQDERLCNFNMNVGDTTPVGRYPDGASLYGVLDMAGNVWEWTRSLWGKDVQKPDYRYPYDPNDGREDPNAPDTVLRVLRGGSFWTGARYVRCAVRGRLSPDNRGDFGFRVVSPGF